MIFVRLSLSNLGYNLDDWTWGVFCSVVMLAIISVQFYELRKVHIRAKRALNGIHVKAESICGDLNAVSETLRKIINKICGGGSSALANGKTRNEFGFCVNRHKHPLIAKLCGIGLADSALLLEAERPDFVTLNEIAFQAAHLLVKQTSAALTSQDEQIKNGVPVNLSDPLYAADAGSFYEQFQNHYGLIQRDAHFVQRAIMGLCEGFTALGAAEALKAVSVLSEAITGYLAIVARHCGMSLSSTTCLPDNEFAGSSRLRLWWIQALFQLALKRGFLLQPKLYTCSGMKSRIILTSFSGKYTFSAWTTK